MLTGYAEEDRGKSHPIIHAACGHGEGGESTDPVLGAPQDTETFDNRAHPVSQVVHNLVSEKSGDYALRVAADRNEALARGPGDDAIGATLVDQDDGSEGWRRRV